MSTQIPTPEALALARELLRSTGYSPLGWELEAAARRIDAFAQARAAAMLGLLRDAKCPHCDGSGVVVGKVRDRQYVSRDMAMAAGDPDWEGAVYSEEQYEPEQCEWCARRNAEVFR